MIMLNIDMPKSCSECPLIAYSDMYVEEYCVVGGTYDEDKRPDDCPIVAQVEQEPKTGHWTTAKGSMNMTCSNCSKETWYSGRNDYRYCPNCGAKMG